ncbi:MAG: outer membrane beta-barrel protein [Ignavibacteria bacterium]|jgi:opacity protein-like surface antigen
MIHIKNSLRIFTILFLISCTISIFRAQTIYRSIGVDVGWYKPSMDYWNDNSSFAEGDENFGGDFTGRLNIQANIIDPLRVKLGAEYWNESINRQNFPASVGLDNNKLSIRLIGLTGSAIVDFPLFNIQALQTYIGVGGGYYFIQKKVETAFTNGTSAEDTDDGRDFIWHTLIGVEKELFSNFSAGLEFRYLLGDYTQQLEDVYGNVSDENVSLSGPEITLTFNYLFEN